MRIGLGFDIHRLEEGRLFILGGITIPSEKGPVGHSDGDCLLHAIADALYGALALGDIGRHFPDTDPENKNRNSVDFLNHAEGLVREMGYRIVNLDANVIVESPKLSPYIDEIRGRVARLLHLDTDLVSVKAKTHEKLDAIGNGNGVQVQVIVLLESGCH